MLRGVLVVSLAVNLAVAAAFAGAAWRHKDNNDGGGGRGAGGPAIYMKALPSEARRAIRAELAPREGRLDPAPMIALLRTPQFDAQAAAAILADQRAAGLERAQMIGAAWLGQVVQMTAAQRAEYAQRLEELAARRAPR